LIFIANLKNPKKKKKKKKKKDIYSNKHYPIMSKH